MISYLLDVNLVLKDFIFGVKDTRIGNRKTKRFIAGCVFKFYK